MRAHGERIPVAEAYMEQAKRQKMDSYKESVEQQIADGLAAYQREKNETSEYEFMKLNNWDNGRTLVIGILGCENGKVTHSHTVEIVESLNPEYFSKCMMKYAPNQALSNDKPF